MSVGTDSVIRPEFGTEAVWEPWEDAICAQGLASCEQSLGHRGFGGIIGFLRRMRGLRNSWRARGCSSCNLLQREDQMFPLLPMQRVACNSFHGTFVPGRGIFPHIPTHLTVLGAVGCGAIWTLDGLPSMDEVRARSRSARKTASLRMTPLDGIRGPLDLSIRQMFK